MEPTGDDDLRLLSRYARDRDEAAFASLVRRHLDLVYGAAVRRVGDRHLAEDVTQAVFVILARRAASVSTRHRGPLSYWLLTAVRYAAKNALRIRRRRRAHEEEFTRMRGVNPQIPAGAGACSSNPADVLIWHELAGRLDDAVLKLPAADRDAVLLRFFEDRPVREIALALNVSEDAAKQRVSRAVAKLRQRLDRSGAGGVALVAAPEFTRLLETHLVQTAPPGLAGACCAAATAGAACGGAGFLIAKGAMTMMTLTKTKIVAGAAAVAVVLGIGGAMTVNRTLARDAKSADGPTPVQFALAEPQTSAEKADKAAKPSSDVNKDRPKKSRKFSVANSLPVIVSSTPKAGSTDVDPSITEIKVTFSKDMIDGSWSWAQVSDETFPKTTGKPHYEADNRTCVLPVKLEPGKCYVLSLNNPPFTNFVDEDGRKAMGYTLVFETKK